MESLRLYIKEKFRSIARKIKKLRLQKMHLDYIAGMLSIPVLITAIIINFGNLSKNKPQTPVSPTPQIIVVTPKNQNNPASQINPTSEICKKTVGPITISYPQEGQTVSDNPVCFIINYSDQSYCSVVWSYSVNNGTWSDYNTNAPCVYNIPNGNVSFQLRVNSTVSSDAKMLSRNFVYSGAGSPTTTLTPTFTPTPTRIASGSASL
ncbi:MAG: hypothetical protein ACREGI_03510 [Candidatus Levyibacteriota bacterium]